MPEDNDHIDLTDEETEYSDCDDESNTEDNYFFHELYTNCDTEEDLMELAEILENEDYPDTFYQLENETILQYIFDDDAKLAALDLILRHNFNFIEDVRKLFLHACVLGYEDLACMLGDHIGFDTTDDEGNTALMWSIKIFDTYGTSGIPGVISTPIQSAGFIYTLMEFGVNPLDTNDEGNDIFHYIEEIRENPDTDEYTKTECYRMIASIDEFVSERM